MSYVGKWAFHSFGTINDDDEFVFLSADEYLNSKMPYIDETDEEAVADELKERKQTIGMQLKFCDDGKYYMLMPIPEGVSKEEVEEAVKAGHIKICDGMITDEPKAWEERDGDLYIDTGMSDEFTKINEEDGLISYVTIRFKKID